MDKSINLLVVDDHEIMRDGILSILAEETGIGTIYEAKSGNEAIAKCNQHEQDIDIVLLDINMSDMDGTVAADKIKSSFPDLEIIAVSMLKDGETIRKMLQAGASGYVLKTTGKADLLQAIKNVNKGEPFYSDDVTFQLINTYNNQSVDSSSTNESVHLTDREKEILQLIANEHTNQEIADKLYISKRTVDTHRTNLLQKTNSKNTAGLVRYALKNNLV